MENPKKLVQSFISEIENERTAKTYRIALTQFLKLMRPLKVDPIEGEYKKIRRVIKDWSYEVGAKYTDATVKVKLAAISSFYQWLIDEKYRTDNPAVRIKLVKSKKVQTVKEIPTTEQANAVIAALREDYEETGLLKSLRNLIMARVLRESGLRVSELLALKASDFREDLGVIVENGKGSKKRKTAILRPTYELIQEYLKLTGITKRGYVFPSPNFRRDILDRRSAVFALEYGAIRAGFTMDAVEVCSSPHGWRHLWTTEQTNAGTPLPRILAMGGWTTARMLMHYVDFDGMDAEAVNMEATL